MMTMMNLKLKLLQGDLAEHFDVSHIVVSRIISYWIDTMEEHMRVYIQWHFILNLEWCSNFGYIV